MDELRAQGLACKKASYALALLTDEEKKQALQAMADLLWEQKDQILQANQEDIAAARAAGRNESFIDRLALDDKRLKAICDGVMQVADLDDALRQDPGRMGSRRSSSRKTKRTDRRHRHHL